MRLFVNLIKVRLSTVNFPILIYLMYKFEIVCENVKSHLVLSEKEIEEEGKGKKFKLSSSLSESFAFF